MRNAHTDETHMETFTIHVFWYDQQGEKSQFDFKIEASSYQAAIALAELMFPQLKDNMY